MPDLTFKGWMVTNRISQQELADFLGLTYKSINKKVNGHEDFTMDQARRIVEKYHCSADVFIPSK